MRSHLSIVLVVATFLAKVTAQAQSAPSGSGGPISQSSADGATHITRTPSSVQNSSLPGGLSLVGQTQEAGSDTSALDFQQNTLPDTQGYYGQDFPSTALANPSTLVSLSPENLWLKTNYDARVYFVGETTDSHNALGFRTYDAATDSYSLTQLIFPDADTLAKSSVFRGLTAQEENEYQAAFQAILLGA